MKIEITKPYCNNIDFSIEYAGESAAICTHELGEKLSKNDLNRIGKSTLKMGHHSVFQHEAVTLDIIGCSKLFAMFINNEKVYTTSEKSARYTKMQDNNTEMYEKWINKLTPYMEKYLNTTKVKRPVLDTARYMIPATSKSTIIRYTTNIGQLNYIRYWMINYIETHSNRTEEYIISLCNEFKEFITLTKNIAIEGLKDPIREGFSIIDKEFSEYPPEFGVNYLMHYECSIAVAAMFIRSRTISYNIDLDIDINKNKYNIYVPYIISEFNLEKEWLDDMLSIYDKIPQGIMVDVTEYGNIKNFMRKGYERLCSKASVEAQITHSLNTKAYLSGLSKKNNEKYDALHNELEKYYTCKCNYGNYECLNPCQYYKNFDKLSSRDI